MIIAKTPFRVSLFGGGSDYPRFLEYENGMVVGGAIDKYCYLTVRTPEQGFGWKYRVRYSHSESAAAIDGINHPAVKAFLKKWEISSATEINHSSDLPARSGMGSSSSFIVGLTSIFSHMRGEFLSGKALAERSIDFEQNVLKENVGYQDASFASLGGFRKITFDSSSVIAHVENPNCSREYLKYLAENLILFRVPISRIASEIAKEQIKSIDRNRNMIRDLVGIAETSWKLICSETLDIDSLGLLLSEAWAIKRTQSSLIENSEVAQVIARLQRYGSFGTKLLGAGGGGFVVAVMSPKDQEKLRLDSPDGSCVNFSWDWDGNKVASVFE